MAGLQPAPIANLSSTPLTMGFTETAACAKEGQRFLFYPVFLRAVIYLASDGELRVTTPCQSKVDSELSMLKVCKKTPDGGKHWLYASRDGRHFLAIIKDTGRLVSLPNRTAHALLEPNTTSPYCLWFEEKENQVIGCPTSKRYTLSFDKLRKVPCETSRQQWFSQSASTEKTGDSRRRREVGFYSESYIQVEVCPKLSSSVWNRCFRYMRDSYPLYFDTCAPPAW